VKSVLIVDDDQIKADYLTLFIREHSRDELRFFYAVSYPHAMKNISTEYDWVLVDNFLDKEPHHNGKMYGAHFLNDYKMLWPKATCFLYSAEPERVREIAHRKNGSLSLINGNKCYSFDAIQTEILLAINDFYREGPMEIKGDTFSEKMCELKHKHTDESLNEFKLSLKGFDKKISTFTNASLAIAVSTIGILITLVFNLLAKG